MATSNIGLGTSTAGVDTDANAAAREQANLLLLDNHDHTSGKGVKVPTGGLNINADLPMASNSLTGLKSNQFSSQSSALSTTNTLYVKNGELFYIDNSGNAVQITSGGAVSVSTLTSGSVLLDAGNARGANLRAGTNDAYSMILETNNLDRFSIDSNGLSKFIYDFAVQKGSANTSTGTINDVSTSQKSYFQFTGAGAVTITGFANGSDGKVILLTNKTGSQLTINNNDSGSLAANRILTGTGAALSVENNASIMAVYDSTNSLWNIVGGTGGASGGKPVYSIDLSSGSLYNDSAATPVDGTGGVTTGMTYASVTSGTLRGAVSYKLSKDASNRQGCGVAYSLTIDNVDKSSTQSVQFDISTSANFASGDAYLYIYDVTNSVMLPVISVLPTGIQPQFSRAVNLTTGTSYRILLHIASTSALAYDITVDAMTVDSIVRPQVAGVGDWITGWTPTLSGMGSPTITAEYKREGDNLRVRVLATGTTPAASLVTCTLPTNLTIDSTKLPSKTTGQNTQIVGQFVVGAASSGNGAVLVATATSTSLVYFGAITPTNALSPSNGSTIAAAGDFSFEFLVPVTQWSSNITLASTSGAIEYQSNSSSTDAADTSSFVAGAAGSVGVIGTTALTAVRKKRIQFSTPIQPTDRIVFEINQAGTSQWIPGIGAFIGNTSSLDLAIPPLSAVATFGSCGVGLYYVNSTTIDVGFGVSAAVNGLGSALAWNSVTANTRWRVAKYSSIGGAELAPATITTQGTVAYSQWTSAGYVVGNFTGFGTVASVNSKMRREGDSLRLNVSFNAGTGTATLAKLILPTVNGTTLTIDTSKINPNAGAGTSLHLAGTGATNGIVASQNSWTVLLDSSDNTSMYFSSVGSTTWRSTVAQNGNTILSSGSDFISFTALIPISGWS